MSQNAPFSPNQLKLIDWLATPKFDRKPPTQEMLADELRVNRKTLYRWRQDEALQEAVRQRSRELLKSDLSEIYGALRREAIKGSYQHIRLALEVTGEYTEKLDHGGDFTINVIYGERERAERTDE